MNDACGKLTCTTCKALLNGVEGHTCEQNEDYKKFKQTATEKGFQDCPTCASTVELAEACNHITYVETYPLSYICADHQQLRVRCRILLHLRRVVDRHARLPALRSCGL